MSPRKAGISISPQRYQALYAQSAGLHQVEISTTSKEVLGLIERMKSLFKELVKFDQRAESLLFRMGVSLDDEGTSDDHMPNPALLSQIASDSSDPFADCYFSNQTSGGRGSSPRETLRVKLEKFYGTLANFAEGDPSRREIEIRSSYLQEISKTLGCTVVELDFQNGRRTRLPGPLVSNEELDDVGVFLSSTCLMFAAERAALISLNSDKVATALRMPKSSSEENIEIAFKSYLCRSWGMMKAIGGALYTLENEEVEAAKRIKSDILYANRHATRMNEYFYLSLRYVTLKEKSNCAVQENSAVNSSDPTSLIREIYYWHRVFLGARRQGQLKIGEAKIGGRMQTTLMWGNSVVLRSHYDEFEYLKEKKSGLAFCIAKYPFQIRTNYALHAAIPCLQVANQDGVFVGSKGTRIIGRDKLLAEWIFGEAAKELTLTQLNDVLQGKHQSRRTIGSERLTAGDFSTSD